MDCGTVSLDFSEQGTALWAKSPETEDCQEEIVSVSEIGIFMEVVVKVLRTGTTISTFCWPGSTGREEGEEWGHWFSTLHI